VYGGTNGSLRTIISKLGVEVTWVTSNSMEDYRKSVKSNTKVRSMSAWTYVKRGRIDVAS
jgi:O-acetylhomoserine/O-acetylserine sulfhydrylase-like pyridoxal-dependent enzyme